MLEIKDISISIKNKTILKDISFSLTNPNILLIVGDNGAGKSTLLKSLATLLEPSQGTIYYKNKDIFDNLKDTRRKIAYIPQEISLHGNLTVKDTLKFWAAVENIRNKTTTSKIIDRLDLKDHLDTKVKDLSIGYQRRLNIGVSLYKDADIYLMDEPTVGIDKETREDILDLILDLKSKGKMILYITHMMDEILTLADYVLDIENGENKFFGSFEDYQDLLKLENIKC